MKSLFNIENKKSPLECKIFLDDDNNGVTLSRFEQVKYPRIQKLREIQEGFFWRPQEIEVTKDERDFKSLSEAGKHIFTSNLLFQTLLDSTQSRAPEALFASITTLPEVEHFCKAWGFFESIHSFSYSYILRNIITNPSEIFDKVTEIQEIIDRATSITAPYDDLYRYNQHVDLYGYDANHTKYDHKKKVWRALMAANVLEGVRFYVSFACSWAFAEQKLMVGNASIIKFIARDENVHLGFTQYLLRTLPKDDEDYVAISKELEEESVQMFLDAINQEKEWAKYLFRYGSILGLTESLLCDYVDFIAKKRMDAIGLKLPYSVSSYDPLPWTQSWISGKDVQIANQETENESYIIGVLDKKTEKKDVIGMLKGALSLD
jgi:ribonucleoside-diphosphate reductase beta chain